MKNYKVKASYTISVEMEIEAESREEALNMAEDYTDSCIDTEWNGNSVFVRSLPSEINSMELCADGMAYNFECDDEEEEEEE